MRYFVRGFVYDDNEAARYSEPYRIAPTLYEQGTYFTGLYDEHGNEICAGGKEPVGFKLGELK